MTIPAERAPAREGLPGADCPYRGLVPFSEEDTAYFFGRGAEREIIAANLIASRLTLLYAPSGVGKSSVLLAGVLHDLREAARDGVAAGRGPEHIPVVVREWHEDPLGTLRAAIRDGMALVAPDDVPAVDPDGDLAAALAAWAEHGDATLLLILDQFEEFLMYHGRDGDHGDALPQLARVLADDRLPVNALLSLREDALAGLDRFKGRVPGLFDNYLRLRHLDEVAGRQAIQGPVARWNEVHAEPEPMEVDPELVDEVLRQVSAGRVPLPGGGAQVRDADEHRGIEAPFLQLVMTRVWREERASGSRRLRAETLERLGGANRIVAAYLSEQMEHLSDAERDVASAVFHQLVTPSGAKVARSLGDLAGYTEVPRDVLLGVLEQLSQGDDWRILRSAADPRGGSDPSFEIFHDVLADPVLAWRAQHEQHRAARDAVVREKLRARRRRRLGAIGLALLTVVVLVTGALLLVALHQRNAARGQRRAAETARAQAFTQELAASSLAQRDSDPELAVMLALQAVHRQHTAETVGALQAAIAADPLRADFRSRDGTVLDLGVAPNGRDVIAAYRRGTARIWHLSDHTPGPVLRAGTRPVRSARFSADGKLVATASGDGIAVWDARTGHRLHTFAPGGDAVGVRWAPAGDRLLAIVNRHAAMYAARTGRRLRAFPTPGVLAVQWGIGNRPLIAGSRGAQLWDPEGRKVIRKLRGSTYQVTADALGLRAAVVTRNRLRVWDLPTGRARWVRMASINDAQMSRDGRAIIANGLAARVVDAYSGTPEAALPTGYADVVRISPDASTVATIGGATTIWDARTGLQLEKVAGGSVATTSATFTPSSDLVTGGADGTVRVWRAGNAPTVARLGDSGGRPAFDPSGRRLATAGGYVWRVATGRSVHIYPFFASRAAFSPRGDRIVFTGDELRRPTVYAPDGDRRIATLGRTGHGPRAISARYSPDGKLIVTGESDGTVRLWSGTTFAHVRTIGPPQRNSRINDAAFSSDGRLIAAGGRRGVLRVYTTRTGREVRAFRVQGAASGPDARRAPIAGVAFQPHGDLVAAASGDGRAHVWNMRTGLREDLPSGEAVTSVDFSPNGRLLVTASHDGTARLWDIATGRQLALLVNSEHTIQAAVFSPDGRRIAIAPEDDPTRVVACTVCGTTSALIATARGLVTRKFTPGERATLLHER